MATPTKRERFFEAGKAALKNVLRPAPDAYICPLCIEIFEDLQKLTLEHAPPKSLKGQAICLTCRDCNSTAGHALEGPLHLERQIRSFMFPDGQTHRARLTADGISLNVDVSRSEKGFQIVVPPDQNPPEVAKESERILREVAERSGAFNITKSVKYRQPAADAAYLKAAYLGAFAKFGYRWIFSRHLDAVRLQIREPKQKHLEAYRVYTKTDDLPWERGLFLLDRPKACMLAKMDNTSVLLPWIKDIGGDIYDWLMERRDEKSPMNFGVADGWEWPDTMELSIDQLPATEP